MLCSGHNTPKVSAKIRKKTDTRVQAYAQELYLRIINKATNQAIFSVAEGFSLQPRFIPSSLSGRL